MSNLSWLEKLEDLRTAMEDGEHNMTAWEIEFVEDIWDRCDGDDDWEPTQKQESKISDIWERWNDER